MGTREQKNDYYVSQGKDSKERYNRRKMVDIAESQYDDFPK